MNTCLPPLVWNQAVAPDIQCIEALGEGDFCTCYLVNRTRVLRLAKHAKASASLRREILLLPQLQRHVAARIPRIEGAGTQADTGKRFVFYPLVPGAILESDVLHSLETICRTELVRQMAEFAAQLHSFPVDRARACGIEEVDPRRYLPELIRRARAGISHRLDAVVWRYYEQLVERYLEAPALHTYAPSLLHGDLSPEHFLADLDRCALTGVIDFGDSFIGDPLRDMIFVLEDYGEDILDLFLTFYSPGTKPEARRRVRIFQQLNDVEYCLSQLTEGEEETLEEAIRTLVTHATSEAVI